MRATPGCIGRDVAIRYARQDTFSERFEREARAVAALNHPNIWDPSDDVGPNFLVMELVEGATLADRIATGRRSADRRVAQSPGEVGERA